MKHPIHYAFLNLKAGAARRNIPFMLSLDEFEKFVSETEYMQRKHKTKKNSLTIDRITENGPYTVNNIQVITRSKNTSKYFRETGKIRAY